MNTNNPVPSPTVNDSIQTNSSHNYVPISSHPLIEEYLIVIIIGVPILILSCFCLIKYFSSQGLDIHIRKHKDSNTEDRNKKQTLNIANKRSDSHINSSKEINKVNDLIIDTIKNEKKLKISKTKERDDIGTDAIMANIRVETASNSSLGDETGSKNDNISEGREVQLDMYDNKKKENVKKFNFGH